VSLVDLRPAIASLAPTLSALCGVSAPFDCSAPALEPVLGLAREVLDGEPVRRFLVFAPDALGDQLRAARPDLFARVAAAAPLAVPLRSIDPPWTPVCFASMFTGAMPDRHGIRKYEKPVLSIDTVFDAFARAGRRVAIVAVHDSSMDRIFRGRALDYFSEKYDPWVTEKALALVAADKHDLVVAYHQEYDDVMHAVGPVHPRALRGARNHVEAFTDLAAAFESAWARHPRALVFAPDHGAHPDPSTGGGAHGTTSPADMDLVHFWAIRPAVSTPSPS
jgi:hypothetical protein